MMENPMEEPFDYLNDIYLDPIEQDFVEEDNDFYCLVCYSGPYQDGKKFCPCCGSYFGDE